MIWKKEHLSLATLQAPDIISQLMTTVKEVSSRNQQKATKRIGIVGGGPKGMYALERLLHTLRQAGDETAVHVLWFNESPDFGSGNNYHVSQPDNLLINYCIGNIDGWLREDVNEQVQEQLSLTDWIRKYHTTDLEVVPTDFASRALVGCYLQDVLRQLLEAMPSNVSLSLIVGAVQDIGYSTEFKISVANSEEFIAVDYLLMATGHCYENVPPFKTSTEEIPKAYIATAYPINRLDALPKGESVAIMGLGLTFIDICLHLTEGRGGVFDESGRYIPSGEEPILYPFSRSNLPIHPRGPVYGDARYAIRAQTDQALQALVDVREERQIYFQQEVQPIIDDEIRFAYYSTLLGTTQENQIQEYLDTLSDEAILTFDRLLFPEVPTSKNRHLATKTYIDQSIERAEIGELQDPFMAAAAVWRELTPQIGQLYNFGGLTPESHRYLDKQLWSACCRTSFGPPIANMRKISALADAGIIQFKIPPQSHISYDPTKQNFEIGTEGEQYTVSYLIDGRIARSELVRQNSALYTRLAAKGMVDIFQNGDYQPGCITIEQDGRTKSMVDGQEIPLYFYGTPTEGILFDNDSLSRVRNNLASPWAGRILQLINPHTHGIYAYHD
ncbi:FAD/NAD(P)-binding protein [Sphingobacterium sp. lm-10]|uniref:FAD/NAD(P)-binding protein n=1 Tax=Sphingobacterium sp. lm-10 TaxID=2944904 RepID=UPI0020206D7E|nr:FAD/NAD(P)-binding protein [Sphingobacterium sp. lm-10]MCL7987270.1 FAD/NAD(P)-binding protein [Sphingobacterium sp. lm-10]